MSNKKIRAPKKIKVGANTIDLTIVSPEELNDDYGAYFAGLNKIKVVKDLSPQQEAMSVLHECLHALFFDTGQKYIDMNQEEAIVSALEGRLGALIKDNPKLITYLQENLR